MTSVIQAIVIMQMKTHLIIAILKIALRNNLSIKNKKLKILFYKDNLFKIKSQLKSSLHLLKKEFSKELKICSLNSLNLRWLLKVFNLNKAMLFNRNKTNSYFKLKTNKLSNKIQNQIKTLLQLENLISFQKCKFQSIKICQKILQIKYQTSN